MRTIEKIRRYPIKEIDDGIFRGIINGCGGKGGVNFSEIIKLLFENFENFKNEKSFELWLDIETLCREHDLDYFYKIGFRKANFIFARGVFRLIKSWTSFFERFIIFLIIYFLLNKYGKKYYTSPQPSPLRGEGE